MEPSFRSYPTAAGVNDSVISVLEDELVVTSMISLRGEHFEKLPRVKVGQRALLLRVQESYVT